MFRILHMILYYSLFNEFETEYHGIQNNIGNKHKLCWFDNVKFFSDINNEHFIDIMLALKSMQNLGM